MDWIIFFLLIFILLVLDSSCRTICKNQEIILRELRSKHFTFSQRLLKVEREFKKRKNLNNE